jgi:hypothetical protein
MWALLHEKTNPRAKRRVGAKKHGRKRMNIPPGETSNSDASDVSHTDIGELASICNEGRLSCSLLDKASNLLPKTLTPRKMVHA